MTKKNPIVGVAHLGIRVHDLARSRRFYEGLGFDFIVGPVGPEPVAILRHPSGVEINLILNAAEADVPNPLMDVPGKLPGFTHVALAIDNMDAMVALLTDAGITITEGPVKFPGSFSVFIRDPDRNVIEFNIPDEQFEGWTVFTPGGSVPHDKRS